MANAITDSTTLVVGMILGDRSFALCLVSPDGDVLEVVMVRTSTPALSARFETLPPARIVMEVSTHSRW